MQIEDGKVATFHYQISEPGGPTVESSSEGIPIAFLCGKGNILKGIEEALLGKSAGDQVEVTLAPEDAYGPRNEASVQKVPIKHLSSKHKRLMPGTLVKVNTDKGVVDASVIKAGKFMVTLDMNHPFAGKTLLFKIDVKAVRDASAEELAHGHAHGEGGHHH
ncbi:MAG: peptidylprolyl isomerase [Agarilytica sp.]